MEFGAKLLTEKLQALGEVMSPPWVSVSSSDKEAVGFDDL